MPPKAKPAAASGPNEPNFKFPEDMTFTELQKKCDEIERTEEYQSYITKGGRNLEEEEKDARERYKEFFNELQRRQSLAKLDENFKNKIDASIAAFGASIGDVSSVQKELEKLKENQIISFRDPLPGAEMFRAVSDEDTKNLASKRMYEMVDKCDDLFFRTDEFVNKARKFAAEHLPESKKEEIEENFEAAEKLISEGRKYCLSRAKVANIAYTDSWSVARKFDKPGLVDAGAEEKRLSKARKLAAKETEASKEASEKNKDWKRSEFYGGRGKGGSIQCHSCWGWGHTSRNCAFNYGPNYGFQQGVAPPMAPYGTYPMGYPVSTPQNAGGKGGGKGS